MHTKKNESLLNFKKAKSHVEKIIKMLQKDEYCVNIMQQNLAVIGLLKSAQEMLMEGHLNTCFLAAMSAKNNAKKQQMIKEILTITRWSNK